MKENPSNTSGSMAAMTVESTRDKRQGSFVNSGSKLLADFLPRCKIFTHNNYVATLACINYDKHYYIM